MAKKKPRRRTNETSPALLPSQVNTELRREWDAICGDTSAAAVRRRVEIEELLRRADWATELRMAEMGDDAPPCVREILLAVTKLSTADWRILSSRFHDYIHPEYVVASTAEWEKDQHALRRMTNATRYYGGKRKPEEHPERNDRIIALWAGGPKVRGGRSYEQVRLEMEQEYPKLTRGAIGQVVERHKEEQEERREAGLL